MNKFSTFYGAPLPWVNLQGYTPLEHWTQGAQIPNDASRGRISRYRLLYDLFNGDHRYITPDANYQTDAVQANYFRDIPVRFADLMLGFPPTDPSRDDGLMHNLAEAMYQALIDYALYGVGVLYPFYDGNKEPDVMVVSPRDWYPMPDGMGDVWLFNGNESVFVYILPIEGAHEIRRYEREKRLLDGEEAHILGRLLEVVSIDRISEGRVLVPVQSAPTLGEFGTSWVEPIAPFNVALTQVMTDIRNVSHRHSYPLIVETGKEDSPSAEDEEWKALQLAATSRQGGVYSTEAAMVEYLTWDAGLETLFKLRDNLTADMLNIVGLPLSIFGIFNENAPSGAVSGEALRRTYIVSYNMIRRVQTTWLHAISELLDKFGPGGEIEWPHPLDDSSQEESDGLEDNEDVFDDSDGSDTGDDDDVEDSGESNQ